MTVPEQIGPYTIDRELGRGGMGVVYLGHDTRLDRKVAIKALPDQMAQDSERIARFEREAKLLASLNHPNIAGVYGLEEADRARYLVLEYVEGETLAERLDRGPLSLDEALDIALQIAAGVEAAHDAGVIHRDLKPGNVIVTPDGRAKVLDFGLARVEESPSASGSSMSPTLTSPAQASPTVPGVILGTAAYMSPEQARGRPVDRRTDVWSFGVMLYEMLIGASPFLGETVSDSIGAILHKDIDLERLPAGTPLEVRLLLRRALARDRSKRLRDMADARVELEAARDDPMAQATGAADEPQARSRAGVVVACVATAVVVAGGVFGAMRLLAPAPAPAPLQRVDIALTKGVALAPEFLDSLAISRDGQRIVFRGVEGEGVPRLYLRSLDQRFDTPLPSTENAEMPAFSPDGEYIAFEQNGELRRISVRGGPATTIVGVPACTGLAWTDDGRIVFGTFNRGALFAVNENGGEPQVLVDRPRDMPGSFVTSPTALPGGGIVYTFRESTAADGSIYALSPGDTAPTLLTQDASSPRYAARGHLLFHRGGAMMVMPLGVDPVRSLGPAVPVMEGVRVSRGSYVMHAAISENGTLAFISGGLAGQDDRLVAVDESGTRETLSEQSGIFVTVSPSPDGARLAVTVEDRQAEFPNSVWVLDRSRDLLTLLTTERGNQRAPVWSPDGRWVYYTAALSREGADDRIFRRRSDGAGDAELVYEADRRTRVLHVLPDDRLLVNDWEEDEEGRIIDSIAIIDLSGDEPMRIGWQDTDADEEEASLSPDGRWVAYNSSASGVEQIYVRSLDGAGGRVQVSRDGGEYPLWAPDGATLYFRDREANQMMAVPVTLPGADAAPDDMPTFGPPNPKFPLQDLTDDDMAMLSDGRVVIVTGAGESEEPSDTIRLVFNFFQELERLAPVSRAR